VIISATPDRIRVEKPEGRGGRACREIDEDGSLLFSQAFDEVDGGVEVAVEGASWKDTIRVASSVELELIDVVLIDHRETCGLKLLEVLRAGEGIAIMKDFVSMFSTMGDPLPLLVGVAAPRREPDTDARLILSCCHTGIRKSVRESRVETPQGIGVVPSIVEEEESS